MPPRKFDPLPAALAEIREVLKKYDIAGHIVLMQPGEAVALLQVPPWSLERAPTYVQERYYVFALPQAQAPEEVCLHILTFLEQGVGTQLRLAQVICEHLGQEPTP